MEEPGTQRKGLLSDVLCSFFGGTHNKMFAFFSRHCANCARSGQHCVALPSGSTPPALLRTTNNVLSHLQIVCVMHTVSIA